MKLGFDLGTTTLAGRLLDKRGEILAQGRRLNPQSEYGSDIIRRLEAARQGAGKHLQDLLVRGMAYLIEDLCEQAGRTSGEITAAAAAGNPGICHLLRGLPVDPILFPPHRPREPAGVLLETSALGLELPVPLYLFPLISGYVGGDLVAFLYGEEASTSCQVSRLYIDIGTNGEMALLADSKWLVTSVAAGPAFEGGEIACGMAVSPGAVERVHLQEDSLALKVVGEGPPRGICGSGLVSAIAAALEGELIDSRGTIMNPSAVSTNLSRYVVESPDGPRVRFYRDAFGELFLSQQDVRNFQLAKGAVRAGVDCLLRRAGRTADQIGEVVVTGAFGLSLDPPILKRVALLPPDMVDNVRFVPSGALEGVCRLLRDAEGTEKVQALADVLQAYPLSGTPAFEKSFIDALDFC